MIPDLKVLAEKKRDLHLAEIGAWLHDMGKCSDEMIEWQAIDKPNVTKLNKKNYKKYFFNEYMDKIIVLCGESVSLKNLIENSIPSADSSLSFLVRYLGRCHGSAHIEKEGASNKQTINDTRLSGPFGFESSPLKDLTKSLISLPYHQLENRTEFLEALNVAFKNAPGDTRRPINEVDLWDWSGIVADLYKSSIAKALLIGIQEPNDLKWRLLPIRFNSEIIWRSASSIPILSARKNWLVKALNNVQALLERDYHIGNEVYRDENGSIFVVPDIPDLLGIKDSSNGKSLGDMISESLGFNGEVVVIPYIDLENWWGQDPEYMKKKREKRLDDIKNEIPPIAKIISSEPYSPADASIVQSWWKNASGNPEICTVSSLRPSSWGKGARKGISDYWAVRVVGRAREWFDHQDTTIWIDEVADINGRMCLIVGRMDLSNWLSPDGHIRSLLVKPPEGTNKAITKTPSFARIRRIWETTRAFWLDIEKDIERPEIVGYAGPRLKIAGNFESETERKVIREFNAYEAEIVPKDQPSSGIRLSIFYAGNNSFVVIDNLQRLALKIDAPSEILKTYDASAEYVENHLKGKLIIYDQEVISKKICEFRISNVMAEPKPYLTAVTILSEPSIFMAIVPASKAMNVAKHIQEKYNREMGKVKNRLPITLGMIFARSHMPLAAVIDAGTRMLNNHPRDEKWFLHEDAQIIGSDCIIDFENEIKWQIPVKMGDGITDDVWYPNFYLDGCPTGRTTMFQTNKNCLIHAKELKKGDAVKICLSRFDFEFLDSASRRFEVSYDEESGKRRDKIRGQRPYLLDELDDFERLWKTISEELSSSQIKETVGLIETKREEWMLETDDPVFKNFVHNVIQNVNWMHGKPAKMIELEKAAVSGKLRDIVELYMDILKLNSPVEKMGGM
jgi:hypothetical protein